MRAVLATAWDTSLHWTTGPFGLLVRSVEPSVTAARAVIVGGAGRRGLLGELDAAPVDTGAVLGAWRPERQTSVRPAASRLDSGPARPCFLGWSAARPSFDDSAAGAGFGFWFGASIAAGAAAIAVRTATATRN